MKGWAQFLQRPLNKGHYEAVMNDGAASAEDGLWMIVPLLFRSVFSSSSIGWAYDIVIERFWIYTVSNNLAALSVNTVKLDIDDSGGELPGTITLTDATVAGLNQSGRTNIPVSAGSKVALLWNSDSATSITMRGLGLQWRAVAAT